MSESSKSTWETHRFEQIAVEVKNRVEDPRTSGFDRYVGLEHLDTGSLKIWRWGSTQDVEKTKLLFKSGDIIFGRRNAYLRRVAVADFDGVCSAHAMVLRARLEVSLPEFLPFFMQSEGFWRAALRNSAGSLSPTINWSNIAKEEFALPPLEEQGRIAEVLQAMENYIEKLSTTADALNTLSDAFRREKLPYNEDNLPDGWKWVKFGELGRLGSGGTPSKALSSYWGGEYPFLTGADVTSLYVSREQARSFLSEEGFNSGKTFVCEPNTVLVVTRTGVGRVGIAGEPLAVSQDISTLMCNELAQPEFICRYLQSISDVLKANARGSTIQGITKQYLQSLPIPLPPLEEQKRIADNLTSIHLLADKARQKIEDTKLLKQSFMREVLSK